MEVSLPSYCELTKNLTFLPAASAFVGLATMVILFPVPGYIAKKVRDVQVQRMKMVLSCLMFLFFLTDILFKFKMDARVQDVTEGLFYATVIFHSWLNLIFTAVNVLRMIKLFGWERRVSERIQDKRNIELGWLWKLKVSRITFRFYLPVFYFIC